jgi:hypothetical protein
MIDSKKSGNSSSRSKVLDPLSSIFDPRSSLLQLDAIARQYFSLDLRRIGLTENSIQSCERHMVFFHHLITLSALASTLGGIVRPICFAVLRLMINSNFVGCSTGRSAGLAPFRILST